MSVSNTVDEPRREAVPEPISLAVRLITLAVIFVPFLGLIAAAIFLWGWGFHWPDFGLLLGMYFVTAVGITVGFHRLFVHRSFDTTEPVKFILAALGSMAVEAPMFKWVAVHRKHHQHSDEPEDPHSPHHSGPGLLGWFRGYWHAHIGWFFDPEPVDLDHYIADLQRSRTLRIANSLFFLWVFLGLAIPAALGGILSQSWEGALTGMIWGGLVRIFLVHHVTWSVNSACHLWGFQPYRSRDQSRNNYLFGVLALGEGFHNTHHAFPTSARHGLRWWEPDISYYVIRFFSLLGLAWNVKLPTQEAEEQARRTAGEAGSAAEMDTALQPAMYEAPPAPALMLVFRMMLGGAVGIHLMQTIWHVFDWSVGEVSIAAPVGGALGAIVGLLFGLVRGPRAQVLTTALIGGAAAGAMAGRLPWGPVGELSGMAVGLLVGASAWACWLYFERTQTGREGQSSVEMPRTVALDPPESDK